MSNTSSLMMSSSSLILSLAPPPPPPAAAADAGTSTTCSSCSNSLAPLQSRFMHRNKITTTSNKFGALGCDGLLSAVKQSMNPGATDRYAYSIHTGIVAVRRRNQSGLLVSCSRGHRHLELLELDHRLQHPWKSKISSSLSASAASQAQQLTVEDPAVDAAAPQALEQRYPGLNSWNTVKKEEWEGEMQVQGAIPTWLNGTYLRNGPGYFKAGDHEFPHLFDGYSTLVRLNFEDGKLIAGHAQLQSDAYKAAKSSGKMNFREFAVVPKHDNFFQRIGELAGMAMGTTLTDNANTGVIRLGDGRVVCLTETVKGSIQIDPSNLKTIGRFIYEDNLGGLIHAAHPYVDEKEFITLLPDLLNPGYTAVRMVAGSNKRKIIGRVNCNGPAPGWVHSFAVTENYIVIPEMPLRYSVRNLLKAEPAEYFKFEWLPESGAWMHIMDRKTGKVVTCVEVPNFVTFHFINAYEEITGVDELLHGKPFTRIIVDCCEHEANPVILKRMTLEELRSYPGKVLPDARVGRFTITLYDGNTKGSLEAAVPPVEHGAGLDMNTINRRYVSRKYRYIYACGAHRPCNFPNSLTKIDLEEKTAKNWYHPGGIPTEPFFVPRPGAVAEDDGVVISLVSDDNGGGFIIVLNGSDFTELARADLPYGLPYGLHGCWVPGQVPQI